MGKPAAKTAVKKGTGGTHVCMVQVMSGSGKRRMQVDTSGVCKWATGR